MKALEKDRTPPLRTANGLAMDVQRHLQPRARGGASAQPAVSFPETGAGGIAWCLWRAVAVIGALVAGFGTSTWLVSERARSAQPRGRGRAAAGASASRRGGAAADHPGRAAGQPDSFNERQAPQRNLLHSADRRGRGGAPVGGRMACSGGKVAPGGRPFCPAREGRSVRRVGRRHAGLPAAWPGAGSNCARRTATNVSVRKPLPGSMRRPVRFRPHPQKFVRFGRSPPEPWNPWASLRRPRKNH